MSKKELMIGLIQRTGDPTMPAAAEALYEATALMCRRLAGLTVEPKVADFSARLMQDFKDQELNVIAKDPAFLMALLTMAHESLIQFTVESAKPKEGV